MRSQERTGIVYGLVAYGLWGVFPLYFRLLEDSGAVEILFHRVLWSLLLCSALMVGLRRLGRLRAALTNPRAVGWLAVAATVIAVNWGVYIYSVNTGRVIEASLGYFINPLVTVLMGVLLLHERLRIGQWLALAIGAIAVLVLTADYGRPPVISLILAFSFATYGLCKNRVGGTVDALSGLTTETLLLAPAGVIALTYIEASGNGTFTQNAPWQAILMASTGIVTVAPLLLFAASASRVPLSMIGLMQYVTPTLQFLCGVLILGEHMPASRWAGFGLVWLALAILTFDSLTAQRRRTTAATGAQAASTEAPTAAGLSSGI